jgi:hypothetical protein
MIHRVKTCRLCIYMQHGYAVWPGGGDRNKTVKKKEWYENVPNVVAPQPSYFVLSSILSVAQRFPYGFSGK